jgi:hypothetical protein
MNKAIFSFGAVIDEVHPVVSGSWITVSVAHEAHSLQIAGFWSFSIGKVVKGAAVKSVVTRAPEPLRQYPYGWDQMRCPRLA